MRILVVSILLLAATPLVAHGAWPWGPLSGAPVCTEPGTKSDASACADGAGGVFVSWLDVRATPGVRAQHVNADGTRQWPADGVLLADVDTGSSVVTTISDGAGGAIVVWKTGQARELRAQRVLAGGSTAWPTGGVVLGTYGAWTITHLGQLEGFLSLQADGEGGLLAAWIAGLPGPLGQPDRELRAQHVSAAGAADWSENGQLVASGEWLHALASAPDGAGGVVLAWAGAAPSQAPGLMAQRLSSDGVAQWGDGITVVSSSEINGVELAPTGDGGALLCWSWWDPSYINKVASQRLDGSGTAQWSFDRVLYGQQDPMAVNLHPRAIRLSTGEFVVGWLGSEPSDGLLAQRLTPAGDLAWEPYGVTASLEVQHVPLWPGTPVALEIAEDGTGGAYFLFVPAGSESDVNLREVRAARIDADGAATWGPTGVLVSAAPSALDSPALVADGSGHAIAVFVRDGVRAQKLHPDGTMGDFPLAVASAPEPVARLAVMPNPVRGSTRFEVSLPHASAARLEIVDAQGRLVRRLLDARLDAGRRELAWDGRDALGRAVPAGLYFARLLGGGTRTVARIAVVR